MPLQERYQNLTRRERQIEWLRMLRESREHPESAGQPHCRYRGAWLCWCAWSKVTGCTICMRYQLNQALQYGLMEPPGDGREERIVREKPVSSGVDSFSSSATSAWQSPWRMKTSQWKQMPHCRTSLTGTQ